ncbi:hypothetical protein LZ32DRAFT_662948 [Colletotrichum eremochloae]|nr:hypothetical protein LZ32DRAFT_662948 [Colletotrichum eremochloae]
MTTSVQRDAELNSAVDVLSTMYEATDSQWIGHLREEELGLFHLELQLEDFAERAGRERWLSLPQVLCQVPLMQAVLSFLSVAKDYRSTVYNRHMTAPVMHQVSRLVCRLGDGFGNVGLRLRETLPNAGEAASPIMDVDVLDVYLHDQQDGLRMPCRVIVDVGSEMANRRKQMSDDMKMLIRMIKSVGHIQRSVADNTLHMSRGCKAVIEDLGMLMERLKSW